MSEPLEQIHAELVAVRAVLTELRTAQTAAARPVLSVAEASELVGVGSDSAFRRWAATWRVRASGQGRYPRRAVLAGLDREINSTRRVRRTAVDGGRRTEDGSRKAEGESSESRASTLLRGVAA